jgi:hypothetical protein
LNFASALLACAKARGHFHFLLLAEAFRVASITTISEARSPRLSRSSRMRLAAWFVVML